mmetsp:Transcript_19997/g.59842  ORF Transcript_19997/g.59842 Transcript_19997/m.59842 type:complete len:357 (+) Transcript_19997:1494-2564(+)
MGDENILPAEEELEHLDDPLDGRLDLVVNPHDGGADGLEGVKHGREQLAADVRDEMPNLLRRIHDDVDHGLNAACQVPEQVADVAQKCGALKMRLGETRTAVRARARKPAALHRRGGLPLRDLLAGCVELAVELGHLVQGVIGNTSRHEGLLRAVHFLDLGAFQLVHGVQSSVALKRRGHGTDLHGRRATRPPPGGRRRRDGRRDGRGKARRHKVVGLLHDGHRALAVRLDPNRLRPDGVVQVVDAHRSHRRRRQLHLHARRDLAGVLARHCHLGREALELPGILRELLRRQVQVSPRPKPRGGRLRGLDQTGAGMRKERVGAVSPVHVWGHGVHARVDRQRDAPRGLVQDARRMA